VFYWVDRRANYFYSKEEGVSFTKEAAMAKYYASVVAQEAAGNAIEWAGGVGFTRETGIEKFWRDSKIVSLLRCIRLVL
jgi:alkylation response protein AidB-like acyl-CoA dehydrogenase